MDKDFMRHIDGLMSEQNNQSIPDFEGYTPVEMNHINYDAFGEDCPIELNELNDSDYLSIPILMQLKHLAEIIRKEGGLKLTERGFLPTKVVAEIYQQGTLKEESIEKGYRKLYKETDSMTIRLTRVLIELTGVAKKRKWILSITKNGEKLLSDNYSLLKRILTEFGYRFNWSHFDGYGQNPIGQIGFGFSLILLNKYGHEKQPDSFYAEKYFTAFPELQNVLDPVIFETMESYSAKCYSLRTFDRFLKYLGLVTIENENEYGKVKYISKTDPFDKLIKCKPPAFGNNNSVEFLPPFYFN